VGQDDCCGVSPGREKAKGSKEGLEPFLPAVVGGVFDANSELRRSVILASPGGRSC
jgi:hypothetical protein